MRDTFDHGTDGRAGGSCGAGRATLGIEANGAIKGCPSLPTAEWTGGNIRDAKLRDEALRAAKSTVLNIAEGAGRVSRADKNRAFTIARGEGLEAFAALETTALVGDAVAADAQRCLPIAQRLYALLTGLLR